MAVGQFLNEAFKTRPPWLADVENVSWKGSEKLT